MEVNETNYRQALVEAYARVLNTNPECLAPRMPSDEIVPFHRMAEDHSISVHRLRAHIRARIGGSSAFKSMPKLFTEG